MAVNDYPRKTSMGLTLEASEKLQAATKRLGVDQNRVVCLLAEHYLNDDTFPHLERLAEPFISPRKGKAKMSAIKKLIGDMTPEQKAELIKALQG
ncbi:hypothetical protein [Magnetospirillum molischianum]|uniref:Uncharacterized protein n=1 Tax=Magnetospirillum molischianum DSM 120 TaxID=1150626 RepID=H8FY30_MAGML|nr:hypothetical protein [Magnetospirillum molischianum]CCG43268.1 hypothetical protein PHAMO_80059 [Magnetospirillum molischianum DSM 120]